MERLKTNGNKISYLSETGFLTKNVFCVFGDNHQCKVVCWEIFVRNFVDLEMDKEEKNLIFYLLLIWIIGFSAWNWKLWNFNFQKIVVSDCKCSSIAMESPQNRMKSPTKIVRFLKKLKKSTNFQKLNWKYHTKISKFLEF